MYSERGRYVINILSYRYLNNVDITTVIEMVEMVEILDGRLGQSSVERVRYVINNLLHTSPAHCTFFNDA